VQAAHDPLGEISFAEFLEMLIRLALLRQPDPAKPEKELADALKELLDLHIAPVYLGTRVAPSKLGQYEVAPFRLLRPAVRRMLQLHTFALKAIFTQRAKTDIHGMTIRPPEVHELFTDAKLYGAELSQEELIRCFSEQIMGGISHAATSTWMARHAPDLPHFPACNIENGFDPKQAKGSGLLFWEFEELVARVALYMYRDDVGTTEQLKVNDVCQLLRASPPPGGRRATPARPGLLSLGTPIVDAMEYKFDGAGDSGPGVRRLVLTSGIDESKANSARALAVQKMLHIKQPAPPPPKGDKKGDKGGKGGKKKK